MKSRLMLCAAAVLLMPLSLSGVTPLSAASYTYDEAGRLVAADYDDGSQVIYEYDDAGNRVSVQSAATASVTPVNAVADATGMIDEGDTPVTLAVLANDIDDATSTLVIENVHQPENGSVVINGNGTLTYTEDFSGIGSRDFHYTVIDADGYLDTARVTVNYTDVVYAIDDTPSVDEDTSVVFSVLANDYDPGGDPFGMNSNTATTDGTLVDNGDDTFTYTPDADFNGTDGFTYFISEDGETTSDFAFVTITVNPVQDMPIAVDDAGFAVSQIAETFSVAANDSDIDGDSLYVSAIATPAHGSAVVSGGANNQITYTSSGSFTGVDTFSYTIADGFGNTDTANLAVTVDPGNSPPDANNDTDSASEGIVMMFPLANDTDPDGDPLTIISTSKGTTTGVSIRYRVTQAGTYTINYTIQDTHGATDSAVITLTVYESGGGGVCPPNCGGAY